MKWIREDGWVMSENIVIDNKTGSIEKRDGSKPASYRITLPENCYIDKRALRATETWMSTQLTPEEIEEWFELQLEAINEELDALDTEEEESDTTSTEAKSGTDPNGTGNGSNSDPITRPKNNTERIKLGRPCEYSPCSCGHKGVNIPLLSHSDWCDYRLWKESLSKKSDEYSTGRIWF